MASITHSDADRIVNAVSTGTPRRTVIHGDGITISVMKCADGETVAFIDVDGLDFQIWDVIQAGVDRCGLVIYGRQCAPVNIAIRD